MANSRFWGSKTPVMKKNNKTDKSNGKKFFVKYKKQLMIVGGVLLLVGTVFYLILIRPALALYSGFNVIKKDASAIGEALQNRDLVELNEVLDRTEEDLIKLKKEKDKRYGWARNLKLFKANEYYSDFDKFVNAGVYAVDALRETSRIITPFSEAAGLKVSPDQELPKAEGLMEAFQGWISVMPEVADQMDGVIERVSKVGEELQDVNVDKYPQKIGKIEIRSNIEFMKNTLSKADEYAPDIKNALQIIPGVLAVGTPTKRYMIVMQNDKEIRPTGGFMTNYATFKINNGLLDSDFTSRDMYSVDLTLDEIDAYYDFPDAPLAYEILLKVERWYARDMNYSPDFITSMDQFMIFYNMAGRINPYEIKPVDGIFAIDTFVIKELLEVTGPVTVNGITYTQDNVVLELEKIASLALAEQANRKRVLGDLMQGMLVNVFESDSNLWPKLIEKGIDLATRKHISVYVFDEEAQVLVDEYGIGGRIKEEVEGDYSMIVSTNLGGDKTNWFTTKEVTHNLAREGDRWLKTINIKYQYTEPSPEYGALVKRFRDWVRVYTPLGTELISVEGSENDSLNLTDEERNKVWYSGYLELGPGESKEITFKYYLPDEFVDPSNYILNIQKQSGIEREKHTVIFEGDTKEIDLFKDTIVKIKK
ncbi:DUF4012 domain-containing protein [Patescibacteria group bacterium]|nr:DUF4012 domain-containing protein [Patescibacteria group bacterium]